MVYSKTLVAVMLCALLSSVLAQDLLVSSLNKYRAVSSDDGSAVTVDLSEGPADVGSTSSPAVSNMGVPGINRADNSMWLSFTNDHKVYRTTGGSLADGLELEHVVGGDNVGTDALLGGVGTNALLNTPTGVAGDLDGNMYILDSGNDVIRKVDTDLTVTTFVGSSTGTADGVGTSAMLTTSTANTGGAIIADAVNKALYVADVSTIRKIDIDTAKTETVIGSAAPAPAPFAATSLSEDYEGIGTNVDASGITALAMDVADGTATKLYYASQYHVGVVDLSTNEATFVAGHPGNAGSTSADGTGTDAVFVNIVGATFNKDGNLVVVDQCSNGNVLRKVTTDGVVTLLSGNAQTAGCLDSVSTSTRAFQGDKDGSASEATYRVQGRGIAAIQHLCDQFFPIGVTVEADLSGCTSTIGGNIFELNVDSNTEVTIAEVTIVQNGVTVSNGSTVAVEGASLTVQGLLSILEGATFSVDNGDVVVDSLDIVDGLSTYKLVVSKNSPNVISVLNNANLNGRLVICVTYDYSFGVGHKFNALNFDTFAGQFSEILFVKLLARRSASRSLLEAAAVDVTCSSTDKACVATGVDAEDDDELVPYIAAVVVLACVAGLALIAAVVIVLKKTSDKNVQQMSAAPGAFSDDSISSYLLSSESSSSSSF